jgi:hypothetical protein
MSKASPVRERLETSRPFRISHSPFRIDYLLGNGRLAFADPRRQPPLLKRRLVFMLDHWTRCLMRTALT